MKIILLPALLTLALTHGSFAQTCREGVRDSSERVVQTKASIRIVLGTLASFMV